MEYIKMEDLKKGYLYHIKARNSYVGIWIPDRKSFLISRWKFDTNYLFEEYHWDTGEPFGTVRPIEEIEKCDISFPQLRLSGIKFIVEQKLLVYLNERNDPYEQDHIKSMGIQPLYPHGRPADDFKRKK